MYGSQDPIFFSFWETEVDQHSGTFGTIEYIEHDLFWLPPSLIDFGKHRRYYCAINIYIYLSPLRTR